MGMNWVINSTDIAVFLLSIGIYHVCQTLKIQCYYLYFFNNILQAMKVSSKKATLNNNYVLCHCFSLSLCVDVCFRPFVMCCGRTCILRSNCGNSTKSMWLVLLRSSELFYKTVCAIDHWILLKNLNSVMSAKCTTTLGSFCECIGCCY